ncbi:MAG: aspartate ammonia-lyase [Syntrophobacteraceae bacterium]|jgi:aspartate ammonia-lyase
MSGAYRTEHDFLGELLIPEGRLYGIHTARALENFPLTGRAIHPEFVCAFGQVKLACAQANRRLGVWKEDPEKADAIERACLEMAEGLLNEHVLVDQLQGGAGTSTNMNVNEVLANRSLEILGEARGSYGRVSPLDDLNLHQSTNDTYPTALKLAAIRRLRVLESRIVSLQEEFQLLEKRFAHVVKVGRTQFQDAVLTTLGREMGAYAEALNRDRWRIYKCEERLRVVNLGGTAIGTGLSAPRDFIFCVTEILRANTSIGLARAENLIDNTQNADVFVEVSGFLKACASTLLKICNDLRLMSSGPESGLAEISLPQRQAGSSIMPGKVNPVIPEAAIQAAMLVFGLDASLTIACASGSLELNAFLPLVAVCLLDSIDVLANACDILRRLCVEGIQADEQQCRRYVEISTVTATALLPVLGYELMARIARRAREEKKSVREIVFEEKLLSSEQFDRLISPEAVCSLGSAASKTGGQEC